MRCPRCRKTLEPDTKICPNCKKLIVIDTSDDSPHADVLKPQSRISTKGLGSKFIGSPLVRATRHTIADSDEFDSLEKIRCFRCGTVNEKNDRYCRKCRSRISH